MNEVAVEVLRYRFAHRGGAAHGPDNTLATFRLALERGATGLETDAWLTADGLVALDHDGVLPLPNRNRRGQPITQVRRDELPAHVPTLDELYDQCGIDFDLAVDVAAAPVATAVEAAAAARGALDRLWLVAPTGVQLTTGNPGAHRAVTIRGETLRGLRRRQLLAELARDGCEAVNARWLWWTRSIVGEVHDLGMLAFGYDAQHRRSLRRCTALDLDGVFSDHVDRMLAAG